MALTRPRSKVISSTKWEVKITRKYHTASSATVPIIVGILRLPAPHLNAKNVINENARKSGIYVTSGVSQYDRHLARTLYDVRAP